MIIIKDDFRSFIRLHPTTILLVVIWLIMAVSILLLGGYSSENVIRLGGYSSQLVDKGEVWRLITASFGHMSPIHFFLNVPLLLLLSHSIERLIGSIRFLLSCLFLSAFAISCIHLFSNSPAPLAGSSGIGLGLVAMHAYRIICKNNHYTLVERRLIYIAVISGFISPLIMPEISFAGHFGGFIGGIILSFIFFTKK